MTVIIFAPRLLALAVLVSVAQSMALAPLATADHTVTQDVDHLLTEKRKLRSTIWTSIKGSLNSATANADTYQSSDFEAAWVDNKHHNGICKFAKTQLPESDHWMSYSTTVHHPQRKPAREPTAEENRVLSHIKGLTGTMEPIEPLSGIGRHPKSQACQFGTDVMDISYIVMTNACGEDSKPKEPYSKQKKIFFDGGCTTYGDGTTKTGSAAGPSMPLFKTMYSERCIDFDEFFGWEGIPYVAQDWWKDVPQADRPKLHFYNHFIEEDPLMQIRTNNYPASSSKKASFITTLLHAAKPEDFVVVKVDVDGGPELEIVETIANNKELYSRVDEIFFEYHYHFDGISFGWAPSTHTVDEAIELMHKLRVNGVRSHFWI